MAVVVSRGRAGGKNYAVTLLNPHEKRQKYFGELQSGVAITNDGEFKRDERGNKKKLTKQQRAYRAGYIQAQNDSVACYNAKHGKKKSRKK